VRRDGYHRSNDAVENARHRDRGQTARRDTEHSFRFVDPRRQRLIVDLLPIPDAPAAFGVYH
jgi:hypothetical protein